MSSTLPTKLRCYPINKALEGFLGIKGYWPNNKRDMRYFCENSKYIDMAIQSFLNVCDICFLFMDIGYFSKYLKGIWDTSRASSVQRFYAKK